MAVHGDAAIACDDRQHVFVALADEREQEDGAPSRTKATNMNRRFYYARAALSRIAPPFPVAMRVQALWHKEGGQRSARWCVQPWSVNIRSSTSVEGDLATASGIAGSAVAMAGWLAQGAISLSV